MIEIETTIKRLTALAMDKLDVECIIKPLTELNFDEEASIHCDEQGWKRPT